MKRIDRTCRTAAFLLVAITAGLAGAGCPGATGGPGEAQTPPGVGEKATASPDGRRGATGPLESTDPCASCHEEQWKFHAYGAHVEVSCEDCHGAAGRHGEKTVDPRPRMQVGGNEQCLECHDLAKSVRGDAVAGEGLFERHMLFLEEKHVVKINRGKVKDKCTYCHDPHLGQ